LEGWVLGGIRAHAQRQRLYDDIGYWAPADSQTEVDFVLARDGARLAIEVKAATRYHSTMLKGLRSIADMSGIARRILVYNGRRSFQTEDGILVWPLDHFQQALDEGCLWP
ncbi:MAG: ATP-binding protein, partial [Acidimicrobiia bacterium]|nr:ATP-binding protein [Acidimicrobiia bacterium]